MSKARRCSIEGCERPYRARGWCPTHYRRWQVHGDPNIGKQTWDTCIAPDCEKPADAGRYCGAHRARLTRLGTLDLPARDRHKHSMGYEIIKRQGHPVATDPRGWVYEHRVVLFDSIGPGWHHCKHCGMPVSWELSYPEHPDALVVDHLDEDRGNNDPANLVVSCAPCNLSRSSRWIKRKASA